MSVQPSRFFTDAAGDTFLVLTNGQRIQLPVSASGNGSTSEDRWVDTVGDTMTGPLIQATNTSAGDKHGIEVKSPAYPALMLNKTNAPADEHLWKVYLSGAAGSASALTFLPMADDPLDVVPLIRMYRDGRMLVGADPIADMDVVTKRHLEAGGNLTPSANTNSFATCDRAGNVVTLSGYFGIKITGTIAAQAAFLAGYVPVGFRPAADQYMPGIWYPNNSYVFRSCAVSVGMNGNVSMYPFEASTSYTADGWINVGAISYRGA